MGGKAAKPETNIKGDHDLTIVQTQNIHTEYHLTQDLKLNIILGLLITLCIVKIAKTCYKHLRNQAQKHALKVLTLPK